MTDLAHQKRTSRRRAKQRRTSIANAASGKALLSHFPMDRAGQVIAGFAPIGDEIDLWPLLHHLHERGQQVVLPVVIAPATPVIFRAWSPCCEMATDQYGVSYPVKGEDITPTFILVPLLAFTSKGARLGYGGGYYDRTLAHLRSQGDVFACGVGYAGQEVTDLPTDAYDQPLDGVLTEIDFRTFT